MGTIDAFWHVLNFFAPSLGVGLIASSLTKLLWRSELAGVPWRRLATCAVLAVAGTSAAALLIFGHDGKMATYAAMVGACALALWVAGFALPRR